MRDFGDDRDPLIAELVDLIEHKPQRGGLFGLSEPEWAEYQRQIERAIAALEESR